MSARKFGVPIDLGKNELQNAAMHNLAAAPGTPVLGQFYYDTVLNKFMLKNNVAFIDMLSRANHSGTQLAATISDFDTQVRTSRLDQLAAPTADIAFNSRKLTGIADGTNAQDAVSFNQLSAVLNGRDFKDSVRVATTTSVAQSSLTAIDGITLVDGDRILDKDNATAANRGIWVAHSGAWTRATDADTSAKISSNLTVMVEEGTANGDKQFTLTTNGPIVLGTTALTFAGTGTGTTYSNGTGVSIAGSVISVDTSVVVRKFAQDIGDGAATSIAVAHGLAALDTMVQVYDKSTGATVECDTVRTSATVTTLIFATAPTAAQYRVLIQA